MRELGMLHSEGDRIRAIGRYDGFTADHGRRILVDWIKEADREVSCGRKYLYGKTLAEHLYLEREPLSLFSQQIRTHEGSLVIFSSTVEKYNRYDYERDCWFPDYGVRDVQVDFWIVRTRPFYTVYCYEEASKQVYPWYRGRSYQDCYDQVLRMG